MTRKEWIEKNLPAYIDDHADGGVIGCPNWYHELTRMDPNILLNWPCKGCHEMTPFVCESCWNMELNVKEERKETMTRREFVIKNYGKEVVDDLIFCGIHGCPSHYPKLVALDPSCNALRIGQPSCKDNGLTCTECWNMELNVKEERRTTMTRKEWMLENHPDVVFAKARGGVVGCPGSYQDLVDIDPSTAGLRSPRCGMSPECTACWNAPLPEEGVRPSDKVEIRKTMGEPHIGDTFYTIVPIALGKYQLHIVGEFTINLMSSINDRQVRCSAFDDWLAYQYTFFYDLVDKTISFNYEVQRQAKNTPNLDRSLFLDRRDAIEALDKWTGNVVDKSYYFLKQKGE